MADFLSPFPASLDIRFDSPRSNHLSASGLSAASYRFNGLWRGSLTFPTSVRGNNSPLLSLTKADLPNAGFFLDLMEEDSIPRDANTNEIQLPQWVEASGDIKVGSIELAANSGATAGDLISFRQSGLPDFVTARRIVFIDSNADGDDIALLDTQLPGEIFVTSPSTVLQYCINRPHIRARFVKSPQRWRKNDSISMRTSSIEWIEDTSNMVNALRSISQVSGVEPNQLTTQSGIALIIQQSGGDPLVVQQNTT